MTWTRATTLAILALAIPGCGGSSPTAPAPPVHETFTDDFVSPDAGGNGLRFPLSVTRGGILAVNVSWVVLAPGTGANGASAPGLVIFLSGDLVGDNLAFPTGGPSSTPPVGFSARVAPGDYAIVVFNSYPCGGCGIRVTVDVTHP